MSNIFLGRMAMASLTNPIQEQSSKNTLRQQAELKSDITELRDQVERLCLLTQAMWELISEKARLTEQDLEKKAEEIDLRDGIADGKKSSHPVRCPQCGRVSNSRHSKCLYCGLLFEGSLFG